MRLKSVLIDLLFVLHVLIVLAFFVPFVIPSSVWPARIEYHFAFVITIFLLFYVWGLPWSIKNKRVYGICVLDTAMQRLRGFDFFDKRNYQHSFAEELFDRLHLQRQKKIIPGFILVCVLLATLLFILKLNGIILY